MVQIGEGGGGEGWSCLIIYGFSSSVGQGRLDNSEPYLGSLLALSGRNICFALSEAKEYLERVAASNTEMAGKAVVMFQAVKTTIGLQKTKA